MNIKALFASKNKEEVQIDYLSSKKNDSIAIEDRSHTYTKLDNLIDFLQVYREDFAGKRIPNFEKSFLERKRRQSQQK